MRKAQLFFILKLIISLSLIAYVIHKTGLDTAEGWSQLKQTLANINPVFFGLSLFIGVILNVTSSLRWQILLRSKQFDVSLWRLLGYYYIGRFFNMFMPTSMGGDIVRVYDLGKHTGNTVESMASVFMERFIGMVVLAIVSAIVLVFHDTHSTVITSSLMFVVGLVLTVLWLVFDVRVFNFVRRHLQGLHPWFTKVFAKLELLHDAIYSYKHDKKTLAIVVSISILFYLLAVANVWVSARAFSDNISLLHMLLAVPTVMLIMNLPVSIGGLGLMEAAYVATFSLFGYTEALALSTALLMRFKTLVNALIGGIIHIARLRGRSYEKGDKPS